MSRYRPDYTSHGNYKCPYCNHKVWKSQRIAETHIETNHKSEADEAYHIRHEDELERENERLKKQLTQKQETTKYDPPIRMFCSYCKWVFTGSLPKGSSIENTRHSTCNNATLHAVSRED